MISCGSLLVAIFASRSIANDASAQTPTYTLATYTDLGTPPSCTGDMLATARESLQLSDDYPISRVISQVKTVGVKKLLQIMSRSSPLYLGDNYGHAQLSPTLGHGHSNVESTLSGSKESIAEYYARISGKGAQLRRLDSSVKEKNLSAQFRPRSLVELDDLQNGIAENILGKLAALIGANTAVLTDPSTENAKDAVAYAHDDLKLSRFLNGVMMSSLIDQVIANVKVSFGKTSNVTLDSTMINLGESVCNSLQLASVYDPSNANADGCTLKETLRSALTCNALSTAKPKCDDLSRDATGDECSKYNQNGTGAVEISIENVLNAVQGNMDRWLYRAAGHLYDFANRGAPCGRDVSEVNFLPGWSVEAMTQMNQDMVMPGQPENSPISVLLQSQANPCHFVVVSRGTLTPVDWLVDFATSLVPLSVGGVSLGNAHSGFTNLASPGAAFFADQIERLCPAAAAAAGGGPEITFTGHSMGASVSTIMALLMSERLVARQPKIGLVAIASPVAVDEEAARLLLSRASMRSWINAYDAVPRFPCAINNGLMRCATDLLMRGAGARAERDFYSMNPNEVLIGAAELRKFLPETRVVSFGNFSYDLSKGELGFGSLQTPAPLQLSDLHSEAYEKYFDLYFC